MSVTVPLTEPPASWSRVRFGSVVAESPPACLANEFCSVRVPDNALEAGRKMPPLALNQRFKAPPPGLSLKTTPAPDAPIVVLFVADVTIRSVCDVPEPAVPTIWLLIVSMRFPSRHSCDAPIDTFSPWLTVVLPSVSAEALTGCETIPPAPSVSVRLDTPSPRSVSAALAAGRTTRPRTVALSVNTAVPALVPPLMLNTAVSFTPFGPDAGVVVPR